MIDDEPNNKNVTTQPLLLDADQVAAYLSISKRSVYRAVSTGEVPEPRKIGRRSLWHRPTLEKHFEG